MNTEKSPSNLQDQFMADVSNLVENSHIDKYRCEGALHQLKFIFGAGAIHPSKHDTISVYNPIQREYIDIDTNIAPLIEHLWLNNISTDMSCENNVPADHIWIYFSTVNDLELFLEIVFKDLDPGNDFYDRGFPGCGKKDGWYYNIVAKRNMKHEVFIKISVRFPQRDHDTVLNKLKLNLEHKNLFDNSYTTSEEY